MALEVLQGPLMKERTTLRLGGTAQAEVVLSSIADCEALPQTLDELGGTPLILGWGSNLLVKDGDLPLVVVNPAIMDEPAALGIVTDSDETGASRTSILVRVGAGYRLPGLLGWLAKQGLSGLEGLAGIPGTVGGAIAMNAGSYGCEIGARIDSVRCFSPQHGVREYEIEDLILAYRKFGIKKLKSWFVVLDVMLRLDRGDSAAIRGVMRENYLKKKATQPVTAYSAGCVFKNPAAGVSSGKLLDDAGFKGKQLGGMAFSTMHANFLINTGSGTSVQALELLQQAKDAVKAHSGHELQLEVKIIP